ncbi:hypothetical protein IWW39_003545 [Coemansia spiralis]|uniref:Uncharacterized protein n=1 Tax=Coemansia spiralis TaxID=417178 RepID=A0A9W8GIV8_9FUNG|nr:hypothetical protein IWW39_003545 [Coemansia spiralis]
MRTDGNWMQRICWRFLRVKAEPTSLKEPATGPPVGLGEVRVLYVGKDRSVGSWGDYHHDYSDANTLSLFDHVYEEQSEDFVPYLDDSHEEKISANLMRHQSLFRRNLHRMSLLLVRQPVERPHLTTLDAAAY